MALCIYQIKKRLRLEKQNFDVLMFEDEKK